MAASVSREELGILALNGEVFVRQISGAFEIELDYSASSLFLLDGLARDLRGLASGWLGDRERDVVYECAARMGYYIGEVLCRHFGGRWVRAEGLLPYVVDLEGRDLQVLDWACNAFEGISGAVSSEARQILKCAVQAN